MHDLNSDRRRFLKTSATAVAAISLVALSRTGGRSAEAAEDLPRAERGHALDYVNNSAEAANHDRYQPGARCQDCAFWGGHVDAPWGRCNHPDLNDVLINEIGWCEAFASA
ncbi:high-potential iron-sulfur protein [Fodinicurvata sp. EGI_FJ10296]|uniref:high-potential iron-sulfur protein n=1 Tax=Fodinicurvata sp. EGI_FJ10296 TaxID=3231908 RepID=UPI0034552E4C